MNSGHFQRSTVTTQSTRVHHRMSTHIVSSEVGDKSVAMLKVRLGKERKKKEEREREKCKAGRDRQTDGAVPSRSPALS